MSGSEEASRFAREETPPPSLVPPPATTARSDGASPAPGLSSGGSFEAASPANSASGGLSAHVRSLGWEEREFSDVAVTALGKTYPLHRLVLSRSPYFRALMRGPWADASSTSLTLTFDDPLIDGDAVDAALGFLYDKLPGLTCDSAPRVLAAASYLDLQDLCVHCVDFIVEDVRAETILGYQTFAESHQPYGPHGERVRAACWGFLCSSGAVELAGSLHHLSPATLDKLLRGNDLWVPNEAARYRLARRVISDARAAGEAALARDIDAQRRLGTTRKGKQLEENEENARGEHSEDALEAEDIAREVVSKMVAVTVGEVPDDSQGDALLFANGGEEKRARLAGVSAPRSAPLRDSTEIRAFREATEAYLEVDEEITLTTASTLAGCVNYAHLAFDDLLAFRAELEAEQARLETAAFRRLEAANRAPPGAMAAAADEARAVLTRSPLRAATEGLWMQTILRAHVAAQADGPTGIMRLSKPAPDPAGLGPRLDAAGSQDAQDALDDAFGGALARSRSAAEVSVSPRAPDPRSAVDSLAHPQLGGGISDARSIFDGAESPFRFGVEIEDVVNLADGQARHSAEEFYAGSLWKVSVQAFSDEDPGGRRTLGLFLHRRPARDGAHARAGGQAQASGSRSRDGAGGGRDDLGAPAGFNGSGSSADMLRHVMSHRERGTGNVESTTNERASQSQSQAGQSQARGGVPTDRVSSYCDERETVGVRYELLCPSKAEIIRLGSLAPTTRATTLPRAPKGWGWRTALMFDDLATTCTQSGALRVIAVIRLTDADAYEGEDKK